MTVFLRGPEIPEYVAKRVQDNERRYTTNNKVTMNWPDTKISQNANLFLTQFQQRYAAVFPGTEDTYDAYEKDIAMVSFFFKKNTMFQFKR